MSESVRSTGVNILLAISLIMVFSSASTSFAASDFSDSGRSSSSLRSRCQKMNEVPINERAESKEVNTDIGMENLSQRLALYGKNPSVADGQNDYVLAAMEAPFSPYTTLFVGSSDNGQTWDQAYESDMYWHLYPSVDYWGSGSRFFATFTPAVSTDQGKVWLTEINDPSSMQSVNSTSWNFSSTFHDNLVADIACDDGQEVGRFGFIALVISRNELTHIPCIFYQSNDLTSSWISRFDVPHCRSASADIDEVTQLSFSAWEWYDTTDQKSKLQFRCDDFSDMEANPTSTYYWWFDDGHAQYPDIVSYNDTTLVVFQYYDETWPDPGNRDIYCWTFVGGDFSSHVLEGEIAITESVETYPRVAHVSGNSFVCTYSADDSIMSSTTTDGGATWSTPVRLSSYVVSVPSEYRTADIATGGNVAVWQYTTGGSSDTTVNIAFLDCTDTDGDGVCDDQDNCITDFNPFQEDGDQDGAGDSCDYVSVLYDASPIFGEPPLTVDFTDQSYGLETITQWKWFFGDSDSSDLQNPQHTYDEEGTYDVTLIASDGVNSDTLHKPGLIFVTSNFPTFDIEVLNSESVWNMISADLDLDNEADLIWTDWNWTGPKLSIAFGSAGVNFDTPVRYSVSSTSGIARVGFVDDDDLPDIVVRTVGSVYVFLNKGNRQFEVENQYNITDPNSIPGLAMGYFDNDPFLDIIINKSPNAQIMLGDGTGSFSNGSTLSRQFRSADVTDFNGDGFDDIIVSSDGYIYVYQNNGFGAFSVSSSLFIDAQTSYSVASANALADFDRNGTRDFALVTPPIGGQYESKITVVYGDGLGGISHTQTIDIPGIAHFLLVSDANRDGLLDVVLSNTGRDRLEIYPGIGTEIYDVPFSVDWGGSEAYLYNTIAVADFDRDGNPDYASGDLFGTPAEIRIAVSALPDFPVLPDEMVTTGYQGVEIAVQNPHSYFISKTGSSVAGADYWRNDFDKEGTLDESAVDYNLEYGEYSIVITPRVSGDDTPFCAGVRINGTAQAVFFKDYEYSYKKSGDTRDSGDTIVFYYTHEEVSSIQPSNGETVANSRPQFDWSLLVSGEPADSFQFQLGPRHDFVDTLIDTAGLISPSYTPTADLGTDSVFYWRVSTYSSGAWNDFSRVFAVYIVDGLKGDVDGSGGVDIDDVVYLINYIFAGGPAPDPIEMGDVECSGGVDIDDVVYLIAYIFSGGPPPGDTNNDGVPDC